MPDMPTETELAEWERLAATVTPGDFVTPAWPSLPRLVAAHRAQGVELAEAQQLAKGRMEFIDSFVERMDESHLQQMVRAATARDDAVARAERAEAAYQRLVEGRGVGDLCLECSDAEAARDAAVARAERAERVLREIAVWSSGEHPLSATSLGNLARAALDSAPHVGQ